MRKSNLGFLSLLLLAGLVLAHPAYAKDGKLRIRVDPSQAYVFVDGVGKGDASMSGFRELRLKDVSPGEHTISVYNYGYVPVTRKVTAIEGKTVGVDIVMDAIPGTVSGPWGRLQFEGGGHSAVLLNGKTPAHYVGEADDFNNDVGWKQELLVPPGTHEVTLMAGEQTVWTGSVNVPANQRVIVNVKSGEQRTTEWPRGASLGARPRFSAGIASATVAVGPTSSQFSASQTQINCGQSSRLTWSSAGAESAEISSIGKVAASGSQDVSPKSTTTYNFIASGPGGTQKSSATVNVSNAIEATFSASPAEIRYTAKGGKVMAENSATLAWSATNADSVMIDDAGGLAASGSKSVQPVPQWTGAGALDQTVNYKMTAKNACGGMETRTVAVRLVGTPEKLAKSITEETLESRLAINSIYFPTAIPRRNEKTTGLVISQASRLDQMAADFKQYRGFHPNARLILQGHADVRGSAQSNQELSERRTGSVKNYLVSKGIPESAIEMRGLGAGYNLTEAEVRDLIDKNPNISEKSRRAARAKIGTFILANNRRVDVTLSTTGQQSARFFPFDSPDAAELLSEKAPRFAKKM